MRVLNSQQMREADKRTIEIHGVPSAVLMENAGRQVVAAMDRAFPNLSTMRVAILCGRGNNGGDGFVVARALLERGMAIDVYVLGRTADLKGDAKLNADRLQPFSTHVVEVTDEDGWRSQRAPLNGADVIVDALFGTGVTPPLTALAARVVADVNGLGRPIVAVDLPSGLSADSAASVEPVIHASMTVTFAAPKLPLILPPADELAGKLVVADIGIPDEVIENLDGPRVEVLTRESVRPLVEPRRPESHKGTYGRVLVVAGSRGKTGAAGLCAMAALRSGAGLLTIAAPASSVGVIASLAPEYMTEPLEETGQGAIAEVAIEQVLRMSADVIAVGPGIGTSPPTVAFMHQLVARSRVPLIIDADGLNAFAGCADRLVAREGVEIVITPHPGEMARLAGGTIEAVQHSRLDVARDFAASHRVNVVLKGHRTLVATPAGPVFVNITGNPGMATGGTGDVLTGVIAGWFGQLLDASSAARLGVYLHGFAGDLAADEIGETALIASDVIAKLGSATIALTGRPQRRTLGL